MIRVLLFFIAVMLGFTGASCGKAQEKSAVPAAPGASAVLKPTQGNHVTGTVTFTTVEGGVRVVADVRGLTPGMHGFHVHEIGNCDAPDASSAGGHFNPFGASHAGPMASTRHAGDMGNITAGPDGRARLDYVDPAIQLTGDEGITGRSVIVHAQEDDLTSQPTGNAGGRVACGIIESAGG